MKVWPIDPLVPRGLRLEVPEKLPQGLTKIVTLVKKVNDNSPRRRDDKRRLVRQAPLQRWGLRLFCNSVGFGGRLRSPPRLGQNTWMRGSLVRSVVASPWW